MGGKPNPGTPADKRLAANRSTAASPKATSSKKSAGASGGRKAARKSPLSPAANRRRNTKSWRAQMAAGDFGLPALKKYRIDDAAHARDALGRAKTNATPAQQAQIRRRVAARFPSINISKK